MITELNKRPGFEWAGRATEIKLFNKRKIVGNEARKINE
jgi:hypothetical protein